MDTHITNRPEIQVDSTDEVFGREQGGPAPDRLSSSRPLNGTDASLPRKPRRNGRVAPLDAYCPLVFFDAMGVIGGLAT